jgi:hypothetical protein
MKYELLPLLVLCLCAWVLLTEPWVAAFDDGIYWDLLPCEADLCGDQPWTHITTTPHPDEA